MDRKLTIGYKFCGNCNPYIDTGKLLQNLKEELKGQAHLVFWRDTPYDILLIISGCLSDCAERPEFSGPMIIVAAETLNYQPVPESSLKDEIILQIQRLSRF